MSAIDSQPSDLSLYSGSRFKFECSAIPNSSYFCQKANLPGVTIEATEQHTSQISVPMIGNQLQVDELDLDIILDVNFTAYRDIYNWMFNTFNIKNNHQFTELKKKIGPRASSEGILYILNNNLNVNLIIKFYDLIPTQLAGIPLEVDVSDDDIRVVKAIFKYSYFEFI